MRYSIDLRCLRLHKQPRAEGWTAAGSICLGKGRPRGKSGLHKATVPGNARRGVTRGKAPQKTDRLARIGQPIHTRVRVKRWGKSPPRDGQPDWHGKPHREQCQIGTARKASGTRGRFSPSRSGLAARGPWATRGQDEWSSRGSHAYGQNPAYRPSAQIHPPFYIDFVAVRAAGHHRA